MRGLSFLTALGALFAMTAPTAAAAKRYEKCVIVPGEVDGQRYIAVKGMFGSFAVTQDLPFGMAYRSIEPGEYFCIRNLSGGVSEFIDGEGYVWEFSIGAQWRRVN